MQNARFYEALENSDLDTIDAIWSHSTKVKGIHPGWLFLEGWDVIRESWENIFNADANMKVSLRNGTAEVYGKLGIITLIEGISYTSTSAFCTGATMATNVFEFDGREWIMIHHHDTSMLVAEETRDAKFRYD